MLSVRRYSPRGQRWTGGAPLLLAVTAAIFLASAPGGGSAAVGQGSPADSSLLSSVQQGMKPNGLSFALTAPPPGISTVGTATWLAVTYPTGQTAAEDVKDAWDVSLIAGAYGAQCYANGADCLAGYSLVGANGPQEDDVTTALVIRPVAMTSASSSDLSSNIRGRLGAEGITASSITFVHPYGPAAVVDIQSSDPQTVVTSLHAGSIFGDLGLDGYFVQVDDVNGNVVYVQDAADRAGTGGGWAAPGLKITNVP